MPGLSDSQLNTVNALITSAPDAALRSLHLALSSDSRIDGAMAEIRDLVDAEAVDRRARGLVFAPVSGMCVSAPPAYPRRTFPARTLALLWAALKVARPAEVQQATGATLIWTAETTPPEVFDALLLTCAAGLREPEGTPFAGRPYGESLAAGLLGAMVDKGSSFRPGPMYLGHPALHYGQAFLASIGVLAAIKARRETGRGQQVEASLLDAMLAQSPMNNWWQEDGMSYIKKGDSGAPDRFGRVRLVGGMFECGECGCVVTSEDKVKRQKNGNVHRYTYCHCSWRVGDCSQGSVHQTEISRQVIRFRFNSRAPA